VGRLTALKIRSLKEPGRYSDGDGLLLELIAGVRGGGFYEFSLYCTAFLAGSFGVRASAELSGRGERPGIF